MTLPNQEASGGQNLYVPLLFLKGKKQRGQGKARRAHLAAGQRRRRRANYNNDKRLAVLNDSEKIPRG